MESQHSVPHFKPSMQEFSNFREFIQKIEPEGKKFGLVRITPPKEWKDLVLPQAARNAPKIKIKSAICQEFEGKMGIYRLKNKEVRKTFSVNEWFELCFSSNYNGPQCVNENGSLKLISSSCTTEKSDKNSLKRKGIEPLAFDLSVTGQGYPDFWLKKAEEFYWKNVLNHSPIYAGDLLGTLMDYNRENNWNIGALDNLLTRMQVPLMGVNAPYLYFGMWKASFPWHLEDMDLFSINFIHFGAPKQWYVIPPGEKQAFENFANSKLEFIKKIVTFATDKANCSEFLRHKTFLISPSVLEENGITVYKTIQKAGDVILFKFFKNFRL